MSSDPVRTTVDSLLRAVARTDSFAPPRSAGPPRVIGEQFELEVELGRGGMGVVYRAHDRRLDRAVAIKLMHPERWAHVPRAELAAVFEREARATARLNHPAIVTLHQTGEHDGAPYLVLELLDGASLGALVRRPLELDEALAIMIQVADAIAYAHGQGVLHRDLKPHNIFLGDGGRAWVLDFGLAALGEVGAMPSGAPSSRAGTPAYMAPEQRAGEPQDERTDVWALGLLLYQLVTAYEPPPLSTPAALTSDPWLRDLARLPSGVAALVAAAVAWAPAERLPSAAAFAARLRRSSPRLGRSLGRPAIDAGAVA
jgi:serine/threonine protein kinase